MAPDSKAGLALTVQFLPSWSEIDPLRAYIESCARNQTAALAERTGMVAQELLENAVKYGDPGTLIELRLTMSPGRKTIEIVVSNRAHPSRVALLQKEFERIAGSSAKDAFTTALQRLTKLPPGTSMLGLARIAMEAAIRLKVERDVVTVEASIR
jgi:hypothetical protein